MNKINIQTIVGIQNLMFIIYLIFLYLLYLKIILNNNYNHPLNIINRSMSLLKLMKLKGGIKQIGLTVFANKQNSTFLIVIIPKKALY